MYLLTLNLNVNKVYCIALHCTLHLYCIMSGLKPGNLLSGSQGIRSLSTGPHCLTPGMECKVQHITSTYMYSNLKFKCVTYIYYLKSMTSLAAFDLMAAVL